MYSMLLWCARTSPTLAPTQDKTAHGDLAPIYVPYVHVANMLQTLLSCLVSGGHLHLHLHVHVRVRVYYIMSCVMCDRLIISIFL